MYFRYQFVEINSPDKDTDEILYEDKLSSSTGG